MDAALQTGDTPSARCLLCSEAQYGQLLGHYLADPANLFIISSDFCHWGSRFSYTFYDSSKVRAYAC
jgi:predicted class III extradiol MEMO1 family dioxygenase